MHVVFLQPFGLSSPGGGSRILRALLKNAPVAWTSVCAGVDVPPKAAFGEEVHLPLRPSFGRLERSRFRWVPDRLEPLLGGWFERRLESTCRRVGATAVHSVLHGLDFVHGFRVARRLGLKFFATVHDDVLGTVVHRHGSSVIPSVVEVWRHADARFVISQQMGGEYCMRYGQREFEIVTDGLERLCEPREATAGRLNIYFMGLFHVGYEPNLMALLRAIDFVRANHPAIEITATFRCGSIRESALGGAKGIRVLPFGTEADVEADLRDADLLYLPLPFTAEDKWFVRYSLSTKMITYLGSGIPILYHGPSDAAASQMLQSNHAAFVVPSLDDRELTATLRRALSDTIQRTEYAGNALELAKRHFLLADQCGRFWRSIQNSAGPKSDKRQHHVIESASGEDYRPR